MTSQRLDWKGAVGDRPRSVERPSSSPKRWDAEMGPKGRVRKEGFGPGDCWLVVGRK